MKISICCACMSNLVAEPGARHCPDCLASRDRSPRHTKQSHSELTADTLRQNGIDPAEAAAYLNG
jgi:hypothetical protein